ncbi:oxygen-independent coproporphyrinogen-3 oxidase [Syntrophus gentianae]|uniref:Heme chaperone HemW n=2 Tax=Syntrophus gentianae TaxID=43775 RepID=A0A1H7XDU6_9BACT|nr:oxygen-independent coproporphyrinogen-3 oxidase [Syntrophus gentianae]
MQIFPKEEIIPGGQENSRAEFLAACPEGKRPGLYLHIPFCGSKCRYCNFFSVTGKQKIPAFLTSLYQEVLLQRRVFDSFDTLYIGGGTPSILTPLQLADLLSHLRQNFEFTEDAEVTLEVNPADIDVSFLEQIRLLGINRLNIGSQSFEDKILDFLGRRHSSNQALQAIMAARQAGFDNFGIDLIYGIPGQNRHSWKMTLEQVLSLKIPHLSCYQLTVEPDTPLGKACAQGLFKMPDNDELFEFFMETSEFLEDAGYCHYEVSNFALGACRISRHNSKYWQHIPYLGLGPAAHSFDGKKRWENVRSLDSYLLRLSRGERPVENCEILTEDELQLETLFLGFRTKAGIDLKSFSEKFGFDLWTKKKHALEPLLAAGHLKITAGRLQPTRTGMALADSLALL